MPLKCFIAMAFDHPDTEALYDRAIRPVLRAQRITAVRVDRSGRNDDIDDQIIEGLSLCDFVIADLTYARPSVYFEAGFAQGRGVPVIYTCRGDHFRQRPEDIAGNLKVHFDLQMKPIIAWTAVPSATFLKRLAQRISRVTRPLMRDAEAIDRRDEQRAAFASLSLVTKIARLKQTYAAVMQRRRFSARSSELHWKRHGKRVVIYECWIARTFTKLDLEFLRQLWLQRVADVLSHLSKTREVAGYVDAHVVLCSIDRVPRARIAAALPTYDIDDRPRLTATTATVFSFHDHRNEDDAGRPIFGANTQRSGQLTVHVLSAQPSESEFEGELAELTATRHT